MFTQFNQPPFQSGSDFNPDVHHFNAIDKLILSKLKKRKRDKSASSRNPLSSPRADGAVDQESIELDSRQKIFEEVMIERIKLLQTSH